MTGFNLIMMCLYLIGASSFIFLTYMSIKDNVLPVLLLIFTISVACGFLLGAYTLFTQPRYGDRRTACITKYDTIIKENYGVKFESYEQVCSGKYREEVYAESEYTFGVWREVVK